MSLPGLRTQTLPGQRAASKSPLSGTQLQHLVTLMKPNFLPASMSQPPTANPNETGNRVIAVTTKTQNKPKLTDSAVLVLTVSGGESTAVWSFNTQFTIPPSCNAIPQGSGTGRINVKSVAPNEVIFQSSDNADTRPIHCQAVQPQEGD